MSVNASRLGLGTVQFGLDYGIANHEGQVSVEEAGRIVEFARQSGMVTIDTAIGYGESEVCLGNVGTQGFNVVTKLPEVPDGCSDVGEWVRGQIKDSLVRLGLDSVYGLLLHRPQQLLGPYGKSLYHVLQGAKEMLGVKKIGVSIYSPDELDALWDTLPLDLVQVPFSILDRRLHTSGWLNRLKDSGVEIHSRSTFLQGLLLMPQAKIPRKFAPWGNLLNAWHIWLAEQRVSALEGCLLFSLSYPGIDRVIVGVNNIGHLQQIIRAVEGSIEFFPDLICSDEALINPANWPRL